MNAMFFIGVFFGMIAALLLNVGKGVQKRNVHVFLEGRRAFSGENRKYLLNWIAGFFMTAVAAVPFSLGLKYSESPSMISSMTGVGLIGLAVYATKVIGEQLSAKDGLGIALVIVGTSIIAYFKSEDASGPGMFGDRKLFLTILPVLAVAAAACLAALKFRRIHGVVYGASAGFCLGLALFLAHAALLRSEGSLLGQFANPYPYAAIVFAVLTTIVTQIGFLRGRALEVVPALNTMTILTPILFEVTIFKIYPRDFMIALIFMTIAGVILISRGAVSRVSV